MKNWFIRFFTFKNNNLTQRLAEALVKTETSEQTREIIVGECQKILEADAVCLYWLHPKGYYELIAERGCTKAFKEEWYRLYPEHVPDLFQDKSQEPIFCASAEQFKNNFPNAKHLVDQSKRKTIAYSALVVNHKSIGLLGFSYNSVHKPPEEQFIKTIVNLCAQAIERTRLFELKQQSNASCSKSAISGSPKKLQGLNFLLVDDSVDNQMLVKCVLAEQGAKVDTADNGKAGVDKALKADYQVVIMDIQMPELDGNEAVSRLRSGGYKKPIVALTSEILTSQKQHSLQRGFDEYLAKPIDHDLLIRTLDQLAHQI